MKKLICLAIVAMVLIGFNACQEDEPQIDPSEETELKEKSDVYLEEDYLVFKDFETLKKILNERNNESSFEANQQWEKQFGFKSAMAYRNEISNQLEAMEDLATAEKFISELVNNGYFSMQDSCLSYPFYNVSWSAILNPNGLVKIGNVLYCFKSDKEIMVNDGSKATLASYLKNERINDGLIEEIAFVKTKAAPTQFGTLGSVAGEKKLNYRHKLAVHFNYERIIVNDEAAGGNIQVGLKYELYFHATRKQNWWWIDHRTHFSFEIFSWNFGGNYDPIQKEYYTHLILYNSGEIEINPSEKFANRYVEVFQADFKPETWIHPQYETYVGPSINGFNINVKSSQVGPLNFDMSALNIR